MKPSRISLKRYKDKNQQNITMLVGHILGINIL